MHLIWQLHTHLLLCVFFFFSCVFSESHSRSIIKSEKAANTHTHRIGNGILYGRYGMHHANWKNDENSKRRQPIVAYYTRFHKLSVSILHFHACRMYVQQKKKEKKNEWRIQKLKRTKHYSMGWLYVLLVHHKLFAFLFSFFNAIFFFSILLMCFSLLFCFKIKYFLFISFIFFSLCKTNLQLKYIEVFCV